MLNISPPTISLSCEGDDKARGVSSASHASVSPMAMRRASSSISPVHSLADPSCANAATVSPHSSVFLGPQASSLSADVFDLSSELLLEHDPNPLAFEMDRHADLSSSMLSTHSAAAGSTGSNGGHRVRSGSLFSTNSIWNDDNLPNNSPDRSLSSGGGVVDNFHDSSFAGISSSKPSSSSFLSPNLIPQQPAPFGYVSQPRNRSHTMSGLTYNPNTSKADSFRSNLSPLLHSSHDDPAYAVDKFTLDSIDLPVQSTRNRSQTYSGAHPKIAHSFLPNVMSKPTSQTPQSATQSSTSHLPSSFQAAVGDESSLFFSNVSAEPFLQDDFNFQGLSITTNFENPSLGPTNTLLLDNVPRFLDASKLYQLLSQPTGITSSLHNRGVLSVRVTQASNSKMALVICPSIEVAMNLKANFNHIEIVPGAILYVAFAKVLDRSSSLNQHAAPITTVSNGQPSQPFTSSKSTNGNFQRASDLVARRGSVKVRPDIPFMSISRQVLATCVLIADSLSLDFQKITAIIDHASNFPKSEYKATFEPLPEANTTRKFDAPRIRELRKSLEANERKTQGHQVVDVEDEVVELSQEEIESLALEMLDELPELCYDHIGNTVVQKMFSVLESPAIKFKMVKRISPFLAQLGVHKNGTWAIQKIINSAQNESEQKVLIAESLKPYSAKLFNDQFGNYVLQCCLKFDAPYNDFIFEAICNNFMEISSGRFGVRCVRTILETLNDNKDTVQSSVTHEQLILVSGLIVEHANELIVSNNGSLLITWFLESSNGMNKSTQDKRTSLLCDKILPNLDRLCTHKLAHGIIFKILNNKQDTDAKSRILYALFHRYSESEYGDQRQPTKLLESILKEGPDNNAGPLFLQKLLSHLSVFSIGSEQENKKYQQVAVGQVKRVLLEMSISNPQPYKKLVEEVGLTNSRLSRAGSGNRRSKRGHGHNRNSQQLYQQVAMSHVYPQNQHMIMPTAYGNMLPNHQPFYAPYNQAYACTGMQVNGGHGGPTGQYLDHGAGESNGSEATHHNQDAHVMRQLEQLSLSSAAMGYASTPGTPGAGMNIQGQNSYF